MHRLLLPMVEKPGYYYSYIIKGACYHLNRLELPWSFWWDEVCILLSAKPKNLRWRWTSLWCDLRWGNDPCFHMGPVVVLGHTHGHCTVPSRKVSGSCMGTMPQAMGSHRQHATATEMGLICSCSLLPCCSPDINHCLCYHTWYACTG